MVFLKAFVAALILAAYFAGVFGEHAVPGSPSRTASTEIVAQR